MKPTFYCKSDKFIMKGITLENVAEGEMGGTKEEEKEVLSKLQKYYKRVNEEGERASETDKRLMKLLEEKAM